MVSISAALARVKEDWANLFSERRLQELVASLELRGRKRVLDPVTTILAFFLQILHRNTAMTNLPRLCGKRFTPGAYCQARQRLPLLALRRLLHQTGTPLRSSPPPARATASSAAGESSSSGLWRGHRIFLLDASSCSMPDTPSLQKRFGQPGGQKQGCGFPVARLLMLVDAHSGLILDVIISPLRTHDLAHVAELHSQLQPGDVAVGDRAFCSYAHVALLQQRGVQVVFRLHQHLKADFRRRNQRSPAPKSKRPSTFVFALSYGPRDQLLAWRKPKRPSRTMTTKQHAALPELLTVRLLQYDIGQPGFRTRKVTLLTTLLDPRQYPAHEIAQLYRRRWQIEVNFRHLKQTLGLDILHGQKPDTAEKEILMFTIIYNLVRAVMLAEADRRKVEPDRVSFIDALRHLAWPILGADPPLLINPDRPGRVQPRVRKRRPKQFPVMKKPRDVLKKRLLRGKAA